MQRRGKSFAPTAEPNVIPFIDVLLVLLIIFMVTAPMATVDLHVDLPRGPSVHTPLRATIVALRETSGGFDLFVDDEAVSLDALGVRTLDHALANNPAMPTADIYADARIFVRADQSTAYGNVVEVMNRLRQAHFAKVGIFEENAQQT